MFITLQVQAVIQNNNFLSRLFFRLKRPRHLRLRVFAIIILYNRANKGMVGCHTHCTFLQQTVVSYEINVIPFGHLLGGHFQTLEVEILTTVVLYTCSVPSRLSFWTGAVLAIYV